MITGTTNSGFSYEITEETLDDYELLEIFVDMDAGNIGLVPQMVKKLLGDEQSKALKEHCKENGRISTNKMMNEVMDILASNNEGKN